MIESLILKNFQAHKHSELEFCPGVNCIIGESDEGKTSIIRALYWTAHNKPAGDDFISDFSARGECSSTIVVDGDEVTRTKTKSKNEYWINDQPFKALGKSGVPDEVREKLGLDELNFQNQMDSPFLLSKTAGETARYLNNIVNLNVIDESLAKAKTKVDDANKEIKINEAGIESNTLELAELDWIDQAEKELSKLDDDHLEFKNDQSRQECLIDTLEAAEELTEQLAKYQDTEEEDEEIKDFIITCSIYEEHKENTEQFKGALNTAKTILTQRDALLLDSNEIESLRDLSTLIGVYTAKSNGLTDFDGHLVLIDNLTEEVNELNTSIALADVQFKADFPDICPLCGDL